MLSRKCVLMVFGLSCLAAMMLGGRQVGAAAPNVLLIMVDDLGYSDLGCYGGEILTPNLDRLAADGLRFTQFYNTGRCWPTRGALLTGYYAQQIRRDKIGGVPSGAGGKRQAFAKLLPVYLKSAGYRSYHSGKWHIDGMPMENGFDRSYYLRDQGRFFNPKVHWKDDVKLPAVERGTDYCGTVAIADHAIEVLKEHADHFGERPFFHYLAFTAPHFPLQAKPEDIAKYRGVYQRDWALVRAERWRRQQDMGLLRGALSAVEQDLGPPYHFPEHLKILGPNEVNRPLLWNRLDEAQQAFQASKMAVHAAMVDRVDQEIGRVFAQIESMGQRDNTLVFFLSDNGASAEIMVRDDGHDPNASPGSAATYLCLGPGWSTTCNTPFRRHKTWTHEGGIATPLIVAWPKGIRARGKFRQNPGHVIDIVPTILEVTGGAQPESIDGKPVPRAPGKSLVPIFTDDGAVDREDLWWFHDGHRAIRVGDWKLVSPKNEPWELYHLGDDRAEANDLSQRYPDRVQSLASLWQRRAGEFRDLALQDLPKL